MERKKNKRKPGSYDGGYEGRLEAARQQVVPVDVSEKGLLLDVLGVALAGAQTPLRILAQQLRVGSARRNDKNALTNGTGEVKTSEPIQNKTKQGKETDPSHDGDGFEREEARVAHLVVDYAVEDLLLVVAGEWRLRDTETRTYEDQSQVDKSYDFSLIKRIQCSFR